MVGSPEGPTRQKGRFPVSTAQNPGRAIEEQEGSWDILSQTATGIRDWGAWLGSWILGAHQKLPAQLVTNFRGPLLCHLLQ